MENKKKGNGLAVTSMVLGIVGLVTSCIGIGGILCIIGLLFAIPAMIKNHSGIAIAGLVTSIIGTILFIFTLSGFHYIDSLRERVNIEKTESQTSIQDKKKTQPETSAQNETNRNPGNSSTSSPTPTTPPKKKLTKKEKYKQYANKIKVKVYNKKNLPIDYEVGRYSEFIELDYKVSNNSPKAVKGIKGTLKVYDQFDDFILSIDWDISENLKSNESKKVAKYGIDYNQFLDSHQKLYDLKYKDLIFKYEIEQVNFSDGYKLKL